MTNSEEQALLNLAMHAAMADGGASSDERTALEKLCQEYHQLGVPMPSPESAVRAGVVKELAAKFRGTAHAKTAYEVCTVVCDSDGSQGLEEKAFLETLKKDLGLEPAVAQAVQTVVQSVANAPLPAVLPAVFGSAGGPAATPIPSAPPAPASTGSIPAPASPTVKPILAQAPQVPGIQPILAQVGSVAPAAPAATPRDLEPQILERSLLAGALERIPEAYASLGISQVQVRLVTAIAQAMGQNVDRNGASAFIASLGIGQAAQAISGIFSKLKGLLGRGAAPAPSAYATTYAIGRIASQHYAKQGGLNPTELKERFDMFCQRGQGLQAENEAAIKQLAGQVNVTNLPSLIRGPVAS